MPALWDGFVSFGLIHIPVQMFSATEAEKGTELHMLHKKDLGAIRYSRICEKEGKEVPYADIVRGVEDEGEWVVLDEGDFARAEQAKRKTIDIAAVVPAAEVTPRYFATPYILVPKQGSEKPYALLRDGLAKTGRLALATVVLRTRERPAALVPDGPALMLIHMRFDAELRPFTRYQLPGTSSATAQEMKLATQLLDQMTGSFDPSSFQDSYATVLQGIIDDKRKHRRVPAKKRAGVRSTSNTDILAALQASLAGHTERRASKRSKEPEHNVVGRSAR